MNERRDDKHRDNGNDRRVDDLEALYRQTPDVAPDAGLDRIIRARADEAARTSRSSRRVPWLGGLVTASVAIVAIAVVMQQAPPGSPVNDTFAPEQDTESGAFESRSIMSPSVGADATLESSSAQTRGLRREIRQMQSASDMPAGAPPPQVPARPSAAAPDDRSGFTAEESRAERLDDIVAEQAAKVAEPARSEAVELEEDADAVLARIEALVGQGEIQRAAELLDAFKRSFPEHAVPEALETALGDAAVDD